MRERGTGRVVRGAGGLRAARVSKRSHRSNFSYEYYGCARHCRNEAAVGQAFQPVRTAWKGCPTPLGPASSKNSKITKEILHFGSAQGAGAEPFRAASSKNSKFTKGILRFGSAGRVANPPHASSKNSKITKEIFRFGSAQPAGAKHLLYRWLTNILFSSRQTRPKHIPIVCHSYAIRMPFECHSNAIFCQNARKLRTYVIWWPAGEGRICLQLHQGRRDAGAPRKTGFGSVHSAESP